MVHMAMPSMSHPQLSWGWVRWTFLLRGGAPHRGAAGRPAKLTHPPPPPPPHTKPSHSIPSSPRGGTRVQSGDGS
eukprot:13197254-Heterocapsa_arctica.AAC.1